MLLPFQGALCGGRPTQGDALGYVLAGLSARSLNACCPLAVDLSGRVLNACWPSGRPTCLWGDALSGRALNACCPLAVDPSVRSLNACWLSAGNPSLNARTLSRSAAHPLVGCRHKKCANIQVYWRTTIKNIYHDVSPDFHKPNVHFTVQPHFHKHDYTTMKNTRQR